MPPVNKSIEIALRNELSQMVALHSAFDRLVKEASIPASAKMQLQVALDEIASNVIKYAWPIEERHEFLVRIEVGNDSTVIHVIDDGKAFDPRNAPSREPPLPDQRPRPGGVGVQMVKGLVDRFDYSRTDGRNHTVLTKSYIEDVTNFGSSDDQYRA